MKWKTRTVFMGTYSIYLIIKFIWHVIFLFRSLLSWYWQHCWMNSNYLCCQTSFQKAGEPINQHRCCSKREEDEKERNRDKDAAYENKPHLICLQMANDFLQLSGLSGSDMAGCAALCPRLAVQPTLQLEQRDTGSQTNPSSYNSFSSPHLINLCLWSTCTSHSQAEHSFISITLCF